MSQGLNLPSPTSLCCYPPTNFESPPPSSHQSHLPPIPPPINPTSHQSHLPSIPSPTNPTSVKSHLPSIPPPINPASYLRPPISGLFLRPTSHLPPFFRTHLPLSATPYLECNQHQQTSRQYAFIGVCMHKRNREIMSNNSPCHMVL